MRAPEARPLRVRLLGGLVLWITTLYCGPAARTGRKRGREGAGLYPELAILGFSEGSSPALAGQVGRLAALLPSYEVARKELAQRGVPLAGKVLHRIANRLGAEVLTTRTRDLQRYRQGLLAAGRDYAGKRVGVAVDGGRTRLRTVIRKQQGKGKAKTQRRRLRVEWREPKVLILFEMDARGRMVRGSRPVIDGTFAGPDEVMELLAMHLHRLGAAAAKVVVFLADGGPWIWERWDWVAQRVGLPAAKVVKVLDFCHAVHHISLALEALGLKGEERTKSYRKLRALLRQGQAGQVVAELSVLAWQEPDDAPVWTEISFLDRHDLADHLQYERYRRRGIPLGSGAIESAIRRVVNLRLKGNGLMWLGGNAEAILVLRAAALTDRWEETLERTRQAMAPDRRLDWKWKSPNMPKELKAEVLIRPPSPQVSTEQRPSEEAA